MSWTGSAISPLSAVRICNELHLNQRYGVVEFGPGISTLVMAAWAECEGVPIRVTGIEEDAAWLRLLERELKKYSVAEVELIHAPLVENDVQSRLPVSRWYNRESIALPDQQIDMVIVDGPTAYRREWQYDRYPALGFVRNLLKDDSTVMLDDTKRPGESAVRDAWVAELVKQWRTHSSGREIWFTRGKAWATG